MRLSKIDLSNLVAVGHENGYLTLLIDRGAEVEYIEIPAPRAAYEGLQQVEALVTEDIASLPTAIEPTHYLPSPEPLEILPVNSSMARTIGYDPDTELLQIEFSNGSVYQYEDVEPETWESLQEADSTGKFFNSEIKGKYQSYRVIDEE